MAEAVQVVAGFKITNDTVLKRNGEHLDVWFEVVNHHRESEGIRGESGTWCYYVIVTEQMVDADTFAKFWLEPERRLERSSGASEPIYEYMSAPFADVYWHGGITFYEKTGGFDGAVRSVKLGCDFAHYWDEGREYDYEDVEREARRTIDELRDDFKFKRRCSYSGRWLDESQMVRDAHGRLIAPDTAASNGTGAKS